MPIEQRIAAISKFNRMVSPIDAVLDGDMTVDSQINEFTALYHELWDMAQYDIARLLAVATEEVNPDVREELIEVRNRILALVVVK